LGPGTVVPARQGPKAKRRQGAVGFAPAVPFGAERAGIFMAGSGSCLTVHSGASQISVGYAAPGGLGPPSIDPASKVADDTAQRNHAVRLFLHRFQFGLDARSYNMNRSTHTVRRFSANMIVALAGCLAMMGSLSRATAAELMGYWPLEETDVDQPAADLSGNGLDGVYEGDVDPNVEGAPGFGSGAYFDGFTGQILIGAGDETGFGDLTSDFTVMAWISPEQFDHKNRVFGSVPHGGAGWGWGTIGDQLEITTWGVKDYDQPVPLEPAEWTHAAIVLDDNFEAHFYVNGEFIGTQSHPSEGIPTTNDFYIGFACCAPEYFEGRLDEVAVFDGALTEEQIVNAMSLGVLNWDGGGGVTGDFNANGALDAPDIDDLTGQAAGGTNPAAYDLNADALVDVGDVNVWVKDLFNSWIGDADLDGEFNSSDLVTVLASGTYESGGPSVWSTGDFNGDGTTNSSDLVAALADGGYEQGPRAAVAAVPEPGCMALVASALSALLLTSRRLRHPGGLSFC
jgi:hypothetical protein